jgi:hypothetical protein
MRLTYNQQFTAITVDGVPMMKLGEGQSLKITAQGGEASRTEGTNGAGMNLSSDQGGDIEVTLQESSPSVQYLQAIKLRQMVDTQPLTIVVYSGVMRLFTLTGALVSTPGELATGDKKQGAQTWTFKGPILVVGG